MTVEKRKEKIMGYFGNSINKMWSWIWRKERDNSDIGFYIE